MARKILLADDSVTAQNMGRKILADAGYEVIAVNNGSAALKKIAELKPELVILDVYMPGYSGLEVCQRLKESQETARIPVLLTVGKLEPFKPEEAQRVRAEGYIVKPFEATELLSALSKLEDKIVPRSEPSKPGRFARAMASTEESARGRSQNTSEQNGWKSRIGFPPEKSEAAEKPADDSAIYNPMNRDLRTVVETAGEKAAEAASRKPEIAQESAPQAAQQPEVASVDVGAFAPAGLPQDVTPEEVAAIAAAAAQIQMANAALQENQVEEREAREENVAISQDASAESAPMSAAATAQASVATETSDGPENQNEHHNEHQADEPVSMAVTADSVAAASASRWTAVPVALEADEASLSLEQEMHKAYAAYVAAEAESVAAANSPVAAVAEPPATASSNLEPELAQAPERMAEAASDAATTNSVEQSGTPTSSTPDSVTQNFAASESAEEAPHAEMVETQIAESAEITGTEPEPNPGVAEFMAPVSEAEVAGLAGLVGLSAELQQPVAEAERVPEEAVAASQAFAPSPQSENVERETPVAAESEAISDPKPDLETVKSTAAAWASWRQIRDINKDNLPPPPSTPLPSQDFESFQPPAAETSARAVAAGAVASGAEQSLPETVAIPSNGDTQDVASIVDSVLADLRPKLMAEISRKMAEKK